MGEYQLAVDRESAAVRLRPRWIEAHQSLAQAYDALGRKHEAETESALAAALPPSSPSDAPPYLSVLYQGSLLTGKLPR
ncbi:hypothetical protein SBA3_1590003 [Candidatus Sulfopaludibacter sp. SbA3]|nr:hypothetical protein SBA3_1590003 [Candidatus Sulfopaludibacter sp. SbA3]